MTAAYRLAGLLRYAALQFVVLTACAMAAYAGGTWWDATTAHYRFTENFFSDLGATHVFSGRANYVSCALFSVALVTLGGALVAFAWTWRQFACERGRAVAIGVVSAVLATASGLAFIGVALAPIDRALDVHNTCVIAAFGLLLGYVAAITFVMWRNGIDGGRLAANLGYLALVAGYVALVVLGPRMTTPHGLTTQVIGQKLVVYGSMLHIVYLATTTRRTFSRPRPT